jgi:tetratricopeptide (TPR) repeat protein
MSRRHTAVRIGAALLFFGLLPCLPWLDRELEAREKRGAVKVYELYPLPPARVMRALCFGYNELAADLLWVRAISYYADHLHSDRDARHMERYLQSIVALDERFAAIYRYGPAMLISGSGERTAAEAWAAIRLLKKAVRIYPDEWSYPFYLGTYYIGELRGRPEERAAWLREGADWIRRAALLGGHAREAPWLPTLAASIYTKQGQRELAIRHLQELYVATQNPDMKVQIAGKLRSLQASHALEQARAAAEAMARSQKESGLTFVPPDLYGLLELPPLQPFSLAR